MGFGTRAVGGVGDWKVAERIGGLVWCSMFCPGRWDADLRFH